MKTDCTFLYVAVFTLVQAELFTGTVWVLCGMFQVDTKFLTDFLWGMFEVAFDVFIIASCCSWILSSWHFVLLMTLIISIIVCHRKGNLRLKMLLIVRNSEIHITLRCSRRVVSAFFNFFWSTKQSLQTVTSWTACLYFRMSAHVHVKWCHMRMWHGATCVRDVVSHPVPSVAACF